jgi:Zn finger protein HypA/HybF involved in hydrogenase expression
MSGKGDTPRPLSVSQEQFASNWEMIFGKKLKTQGNYRCWCYNCNKNYVPMGEAFPYVMTRMIVCPTCGNKRCPKSTDHNLACTNSNEPGQPGSRY